MKDNRRSPGWYVVYMDKASGKKSIVGKTNGALDHRKAKHLAKKMNNRSDITHIEKMKGEYKAMKVSEIEESVLENRLLSPGIAGTYIVTIQSGSEKWTEEIEAKDIADANDIINKKIKPRYPYGAGIRFRLKESEGPIKSKYPLIEEKAMELPKKKRIDETSTDAQELLWYIVNDGDLYRSIVTPTIKNFKRKVARGQYDKRLALKQWERVATEGAKKYVREFGSRGDRFQDIFPTSVRREVAFELQDYYDEMEWWEDVFDV